MKNKLLGLLPLAVLGLSLAACATSGGSSSGSVSSDSSSSGSSSSSSSSSSSEAPKGYYKASLSDYRVDLHPSIDVFHEAGMPSTGNVKILVVPVSFSGSKDPQPSSGDLSVIEKAYFGEDSDTGWESLSSYYEKSSYGKLHITGDVTPVYKDSRTSSSFGSSGDTSNVSALVSKVVTFAKSKGYDMSDYDSNGDGFVDAVEMVYFTGQEVGSNDVWWAYTEALYNDPGTASAPVGERYFWSPFSMIEDGYYTPDIDTHTLVHETGHMMGLDDYYTYDKDSNGNYVSAPAGCADMMDMNVGDHNAYSKMALGWVDPYVVDGTSDSFSITLNSFEDTGECIILRDTDSDSWNGTPYDEYLLLQYYTPTGLNELDSSGYPEWSGYGHGGTYDTYGLQVFHIDSRLVNQSGTLDANNKVKTAIYDYTDEIKDTTDISGKNYETSSFVAASNTKSNSLDVASNKGGSSNALVTAIPATGKSTFLGSNYISSFGVNKNLFGVGKQYGNDSFYQEDFTACFQNDGGWNDESELNYSLTVTSNDFSSCTIDFTKA